MVFSANFILIWVLVLLGLITYGKVFKPTPKEVEDPMTIQEQIHGIIDKYLTENHLYGASDMLTYSKDYPNTPIFVIDMLKEISPLLGDMNLAFMVKVEKRAHHKFGYAEYLTNELIFEFNDNKL